MSEEGAAARVQRHIRANINHPMLKLAGPVGAVLGELLAYVAETETRIAHLERLEREREREATPPEGRL